MLAAVRIPHPSPAALDRVRSHLPVLAVSALLVEFWAELAVLVPAGTPYRGLTALLLAALAVAVVGGRRAPLECAVVVFAIMALLPALSRVYYNELLLPFITPFVAAFWLGAYAGRVRLAVGFVVCAALALAATLPYDEASSGLFTIAVTLGAPIVVGRLLRERAALNRALCEKTVLLERRGEDAAGRAVADERARIAGELHDVVAHALSAMTVQATGARRLALTRPELAREAFGAIETAGREALDELRRLLGVLRRDATDSTLAPQPSLRHARSLARRTTAAGLPVSLQVEGEERELPAGIDVTAYRVVQDALAAALDHGGAGRALVRVRFAAAAVEIEVRDDGPSPTARPLMGIRERVALHGGTLTVSARPGGHTVRATLPLDGRPLPREESVEPSCELAERGDRALRRVGAAITRRPGRDRAASPLAAAQPTAAQPTAGPLAAAAPAADTSPAAAPLRRPAVVDGLIATVFALVAVVEVLLSPDLSGPWFANVAVALGYTLPLAARHRAPLAALAGIAIATLIMGLTMTPVEGLFVPFAAVLTAAYACAAYRDGREAYAGLVLVAAALPAIIATMDDRIAADYVFPSLLGIVAWLAGRAVRARTRLTAELHETAARLAEASDDARALATVDERRRIARELHDLVAHSISVMVVQAGGARRILDRDPGRALEAASRIERTGREALGEMRHLLGVLGTSDQPAARAPQPTLAEIGELVTRARAAGLPTVLEVRGTRRPLAPGLDLAAYRIVQEALTNALKHAGHAPTTVTVDWSEHTLAVEIRDHGRATSTPVAPGHGLVGMRERVRLYGGELEAGPAADGGSGWSVRATLPLTARELSLA